MIDTLFFRYAIQLSDLSQTGMWDVKAKIVYYIDLTIESLVLGLDLLYHFHMLVRKYYYAVLCL